MSLNTVRIEGFFSQYQATEFCSFYIAALSLSLHVWNNCGFLGVILIKDARLFWRELRLFCVIIKGFQLCFRHILYCFDLTRLAHKACEV